MASMQRIPLNDRVRHITKACQFIPQMWWRGTHITMAVQLISQYDRADKNL